MKSEEQLRISSNLMFSTVLASLTFFGFVSFVFILDIHIFLISNSEWLANLVFPGQKLFRTAGVA